MNKRLVTGIIALSITASCSAYAADMRVGATPPPQAVPVIPPPGIPNWTGFYLGAEGGGGWDRTSFSTSGANFDGFLTVPLSIPRNSGSGGVFGFFFGYNWEWGPIVGGLEGNIDGADIRSTGTPGVIPGTPLLIPFNNDFKTEELASVRARLGYLVLPNLLIFGTGGVGFDHGRLSVVPNGVLPTNPIGDTANVNEIGWVAGAGAEWKVWEHVLLRVEWLHYDFGTTSTTVQPSLIGIGGGFALFPTPTNLNIDRRVDTVLGGIAYKF